MSRNFVPGVIAVAAVLSCLLPGARVRAQDLLPKLGNHDDWRTLELPASANLGHPLQVLEADDGVPWLVATAGVAWYDGYRWVRATISGQPDLAAVDIATTGPGSGLVLTGAGRLMIRTRPAVRSEMAGTAVLEIEPERVGGAGDTVVEVIDTGEGMDAATLEHVFEPFFTTKEPGSGTGLGLSTVYAIVQQANGLIDIRSAPGKGTTVKVIFPAVSDEAGRDEPPAVPAGASGDETILLVEDQDMVRGMVRRVLEQHGYRVLEKTSGREALVLLGAPDSALVDLLITDVAMPGMDGIALADRVCELSPSTRVLLISGYSEALHLADQEQHPYPFLPKPFSNEELGRVVRGILDATP